MTRHTSPHGLKPALRHNTHRSFIVQHYQAGGIRPSHIRTPRMSSDGLWVESFPGVHQSARRLGGWIKWSGWLVAAVLLFAYVK